MVTPSLYRLNDRSKSYKEKLPIFYLLSTHYTNVYYTPVSYRHFLFLLKIVFYKNKKGALKVHPYSRYQSTSNTLAALTTFNCKELNNG
jgi:hypothetical protein